MALPADTTLGAVALTVGDLDAMVRFYERAIGLRILERGASTVRLGAQAGRPLVELVGAPDAPPRPPGSTGLFHLALLVPDRAELARAIRRVAGSGWRLTGASDHFVSEAVYLNDPEGNGIELYRDRPRTEWHFDGDELRMGTVALELEAVLATAPAGGGGDGMGPGTVLGHVHLNVGDLQAAESFYGEPGLGFDVMVRGYPGALFVAAGGYHHHVGLNTWMGDGAPGPPPGARGLRWFQILASGAEERELADPSGNRLVVRSPRAAA